MQGTFALSYLVHLALARIAGFLTHWYIDATRVFRMRYIAAARSLESTVAARAMWHLLFRPLYGDYSVVGRIIGPIFRFGRLVGGGVAHAFIFVSVFVAWLVWIMLPPLLITYAIGLFSR